VKVAAVPEKGKANDELIRFLPREAGVPRENVIVVAALSARTTGALGNVTRGIAAA